MRSERFDSRPNPTCSPLVVTMTTFVGVRSTRTYPPSRSAAASLSKAFATDRFVSLRTPTIHGPSVSSQHIGPMGELLVQYLLFTDEVDSNDGIRDDPCGEGSATGRDLHGGRIVSPPESQF